MNKKILAAVVCAATVLSLAGCGEKGTSSTAGGNSTPAANNSSAAGGNTSTPAGGESTPAPAGDLTDDDDVLSILAWENNEDVPLLIDFFCEKSGISKDKVKFVGLGSGGEAAREQYAQYLKTDGDADLILCDADWVGQYSNSDMTVPLSELGITTSQYPDAYKYTLAVGTNEAGEFTGATWQATAGCFVYRADLAEQYLGVKTPEEMQAKVKDWDTFKATAIELYEKSGGKTKLQATEGGLWQVRQAALSKPWVVGGKFQMDSVAEEFYDFAKDYLDNNVFDKSVKQWDASWYAAVKSGAALGDFVPTWGLKGNSGSIIYNFAAGNDKGEGTADNSILSACEGPQGWFWGGTYICATNKINTKKTAAEFIRIMTQDQAAMREYAEKNGDFMNNSKAMDGVVFNNPILKDGQNQFAILLEKAKTIDLDGKITRYDSQIKGAFNDSVNALLNGEVADKDAAIVQFKSKVVEAFPTEFTVE